LQRQLALNDAENEKGTTSSGGNSNVGGIDAEDELLLGLHAQQGRYLKLQNFHLVI